MLKSEDLCRFTKKNQFVKLFWKNIRHRHFIDHRHLDTYLLGTYR